MSAVLHQVDDEFGTAAWRTDRVVTEPACDECATARLAAERARRQAQ